MITATLLPQRRLRSRHTVFKLSSSPSETLPFSDDVTVDSEATLTATAEQLRELEQAVFQIRGLLPISLTLFVVHDQFAEEVSFGVPLDELMLRAIVRHHTVQRELARSFKGDVLQKWMIERWMAEAEQALVKTCGPDWRAQLDAIVNGRH
jgi:hypothetical protein